MRYRAAAVVVTLVSFTQACTDVVTQPTVVQSGQPVVADTAIAMGHANLVAFAGQTANTVYEAPASVTPDNCFGDRNPYIADRDYDRLDDNCELELAKMFAPHWGMSPFELGCEGGEPYWAAKYFPGPQVVRIAYMPAYYRDCGTPQFGFGGGHTGDSEFVMVQVVWNGSTQRWEFQLMWLSAHYGTEGNRSEWVDAAHATFTGRGLGHPYVEVSWHKHANYANRDKCLQAAYDFESCDNGADPDLAFRIPVGNGRNAGSRHRDILGCVLSTDPDRASTGRRECFYWPDSEFRGWERVGYWYGDSPRPYRAYLMSHHFEMYVPESADYACEIVVCSGDWGPGQSQPFVGGPADIVANESGSWSIDWIKPLSYCTWYLDEAVVQEGSCGYSTYFSDGGMTTHWLRAIVTDFSGESLGTPSFAVNVHSPGCGLSDACVRQETPKRPSRSVVRSPFIHARVNP